MKLKPGEDNLKVAVELAEKSINAFPNSSGASYALSLLQDIRALSLDIAIRGYSIPGAPIDIVYTSKNIDTLYLTVYPLTINETQHVDIKKPINYYQLLNKTPIKSWIRKPVSVDDYRIHMLKDSLDGLPIGDYILIAQNRPITDTLNQRLINKFAMFKVSGMVVSRRSLPGKINEFKVFESRNGLPLKGVKIEDERQSIVNPLTNAEGYSSIKQASENYNTATAILGRDSIPIFLNTSYGYGEDDEGETKILLFTDRPIYRPGQEVFYKGLVLMEKSGSNTIIAQQKVTVQFLDVNSNELSKAEKISNEYGSFSGSFTIPTGKLNGNFHIETEFGQIEVRVEEYKRPTFEVKFLSSNEGYLYNDTVRVKGTALSYAGYPIANAAVKYTISVSNRQILDGMATTDDEGIFQVAFFPLKKDELAYRANNYTVKAVVTDLAGETRSASKNLELSDGGLTISSSSYEEVLFIKKEKEVS
ncbi:MAG: hypothetical protein EOO85_27185, partial [Pedobacter sp.]